MFFQGLPWGASIPPGSDLTSPSAGCALSLVSQTQRHRKPTLLNSPSGPLRLVLLIRPPL